MNFFGSMTRQQAKNANPLTLAYVGDAVQSLIVREKLVHDTDFKTENLHKLATEHVNAHAQSVLADEIFDKLTTEEKEIYMRGRNGKTNHVAKNQTKADYKKASGLEAVIGFLWLVGESDRILQLLGLNE